MPNISNVSHYYNVSLFNIVMACLYAIIVPVGLVGNALIITIVTRTKSMHTTTNLLLANVAVADVISLLWCPIPYAISMTNAHPTGFLGDLVCKFFTGYATTCLTVSVTFVTLVLLAIERYHAIVKPFSGRLRLTVENIGYAIALIWLTSLISSMNGFLNSNYDQRSRRCQDPWTLEKVHLSRTLFGILLGVSVVSSAILFYCYMHVLKDCPCNNDVSPSATAPNQATDAATKRKLARLFLMVTIAFYVSYTPFLIFELVVAHKDPNDLDENYGVLYVVYRIVGFFMYTNSCLNPFFYGFQSSNYRKHFKNILCCRSKVSELPAPVIKLRQTPSVKDICKLRNDDHEEIENKERRTRTRTGITATATK